MGRKIRMCLGHVTDNNELGKLLCSGLQRVELLEKAPLRLTCRCEHARALAWLHYSKPADVSNRGSFSFLHNGTFAGIEILTCHCENAIDLRQCSQQTADSG
jgi:hypothetical protein